VPLDYLLSCWFIEADSGRHNSGTRVTNSEHLAEGRNLTLPAFTA
jgi:hypothetical protein